MGCSILAGRFKVPFCFIALFGIICQVTGLSLYSSIDLAIHLWPGQFGYLALASLGMGLTLGAFSMLRPLVVGKEDHSIVVGLGCSFDCLVVLLEWQLRPLFSIITSTGDCHGFSNLRN
jgi:hypothetical protein